MRTEVRQVVAWRQPVLWTTCTTLWAAFAVATLIPDLDLPLRAIAPLGFAAALLRTAALVAGERSTPSAGWLRGLWLCADAALLTGLLDITGGPFNPFVVLYGVFVWLALTTVSRTWAVLVSTVSLGGYAWLIVDHLQVGLAEHHRLNDFPTHLFTMLFAGSHIADLVAHYISQLTEARERAARSERLASLTTLAAGAAHELSTPLSTIAVAAKELERSGTMSGTPLSQDLLGDVQLIQHAVQRCRSILDGMSGRATGGTTVDEHLGPAATAELACASLPDERRQRGAPGCCGRRGASDSKAASMPRERCRRFLRTHLMQAGTIQSRCVSIRMTQDCGLRSRIQAQVCQTKRDAGSASLSTRPNPPARGSDWVCSLRARSRSNSGGLCDSSSGTGRLPFLNCRYAADLYEW